MGKNTKNEERETQRRAPPAPRPGVSRLRIWRVWSLRGRVRVRGRVLLIRRTCSGLLATHSIPPKPKPQKEQTPQTKTQTRKLPQTKKEQNKKGRTSSSSRPARTHSRSGTSRASGSRRFLRMKKGRRGEGLSWGIRLTRITLPYLLLHLLLPLHRHLRPTRPSAKDKEEVEA
ncbi:hypothetical protein B0H13DRAFT_2079863 [Mycena leptocephala]|nr:hypothetical protein B0H13DRAFT_2079863 [Mycena leptocephala]